MKTFLSCSLFVVLSVILLASPAMAGDCPACNTSADCPDRDEDGENDFCVRWNEPVCGMTQLCCPGQGCDTRSGRPSCEAESRCSVIEGGVDAGPVVSDAGGVADGGVLRDSGVQIGGSGADTGVTLPGIESRRASGCSCKVHPSEPGAQGLLATIAVAFAVVFRTVRRRKN